MTLLLLFVALFGCRLDADSARCEDARAPRAELQADASLLPPGARGKFPSFDGDSFAFTIPARSGDALAPVATFDEVVAPLMRAMGFAARVESMRIPTTGNVFQQVESGVPIETAVVIATPTSVHGTLFDDYRVTNAVRLSADTAASAAPRDLTPLSRGELVLLPQRNADDGNITLRYAYRTLLAARDDPGRTWQAWIDAESGRIVQIAAQFDEE